MPERVVLICDKPRCENTGIVYTVSDDKATKQVILCEEHSAGVREVMYWGRSPAPGRKTSPRPAASGTSKDRLLAIQVNED